VHGHVILTDVHTVCVDLDGDVWAVVHDERNAKMLADTRNEFGPFNELARLKVLLSELHDVNATGDAIADEAFEVRTVRSAQI